VSPFFSSMSIGGPCAVFKRLNGSILLNPLPTYVTPP
jgi:hypothetical protein